MTYLGHFHEARNEDYPIVTRHGVPNSPCNRSVIVLLWVKSADTIQLKSGKMSPFSECLVFNYKLVNLIALGLNITFSMFATAFRPVLGPTQRPIQCVQGALTLRVKRQGPETDHSPPSSSQVNV
jgi:hypothetical protein